MKAILYIHGMGGSASEAEQYKDLFDCEVIGLDYDSYEPWIAKDIVANKYFELKEHYDEIVIIANSIGAYFTMLALSKENIAHAHFISPMVNMEKYILTKMKPKEVDENYLAFVRKNPIRWNVPTDILYGSEDHLVDIDTIQEFADNHNASLTIMEGGEHWFHTAEQMTFLKRWIKSCMRNKNEAYGIKNI